MWRRSVNATALLADIYGPQYAWLTDDQWHAEPVVKKASRNQRRRQTAAKKRKTAPVKEVAVPEADPGACGICRECPSSGLVTPAAAGDSRRQQQPQTTCRHEYCRPCLRAYLTAQISCGKVASVETCLPTWQGYVLVVQTHATHGVRCPAAGCCGIIERRQVLKYVDAGVGERLERLLETGTVGFQSCPRGCGGVFPANSGGTCLTPQCRVADLRAENERAEAQWLETCLTYESVVGKDARREASLLFRCCPSCGVCIEKNGGCDHMTCAMCRVEFQWARGRDFNSLPADLRQMLQEVVKTYAESKARRRLAELDFRRAGHNAARHHRLATIAAQEDEAAALDRMWKAVDRVWAEHGGSSKRQQPQHEAQTVKPAAAAVSNAPTAEAEDDGHETAVSDRVEGGECATADADADARSGRSSLDGWDVGRLDEEPAEDRPDAATAAAVAAASAPERGEAQDFVELRQSAGSVATECSDAWTDGDDASASDSNGPASVSSDSAGDSDPDAPGVDLQESASIESVPELAVVAAAVEEEDTCDSDLDGFEMVAAEALESDDWVAL